MGIGKQLTNSAVRVPVIVQAAEREIALVVEEPELDPAAPEPALQVAVRLEIVPAVAQARGIDRAVVQELGIVPVAQELGHGLEPAELERVQVVVAQVLGHPRAQLAVVPKTKSVTAAHHPGLVLVTAVEDLAAVAETTLGQAAAEAGIAWAAAVTAVAEAGIAVAVE